MSSTTDLPQRANLPTTSRRRAALAVLGVAMGLVTVDQNIVVVALATMRGELGLSTATLTWAIDAYLMPSGAVLLVAGAIGDAIGRRRMFVAGLLVFTLASAICGLASNGTALVVGRVVQGVGAGLITGVTIGMVAALYDNPDAKARGTRIFSMVGSICAAWGLAVSGLVTELGDWRVMFLINVPIGIAAVLAARRVLPSDTRRDKKLRVDVLAAALVTAGLLLALFVLIEGPEQGWTSRSTLLGAGLALVLLSAFAVRQARGREPLVPRALLRSRTVRLGVGGLALLTFGQAGIYLAGVLYLQRVLGYGAADTAWAIMPLPIVLTIVMSQQLQPLQQRIGRTGLLAIGLMMIALGLGWLFHATTLIDVSYLINVMPAMLLVGTGVGLAYPRALALAMEGTTSTDAGVTSGLANAAQRVARSVSIAIAATVATVTTGTVADAGSDQPRALAAGYGMGLLVVAVLVVVAVAAAIGLARRQP